jgi:Tol biopolymer transport system component
MSEDFRGLMLATCVALGSLTTPAQNAQPAGAAPDLLAELKHYPHNILIETKRDGNWEIYRINADGSQPVNLTKTPDVDELYPKASPDGSRLCFEADEGAGEQRARHLYVMNADGSARRKIADNAREPCWSSDGRQIAFLKGEFEKYSLTDFATRGIFIYDLASGQTREHPNTKIKHLYTLNWSADGKWFVAVVHGGMGFAHNIIALEAAGAGVFDLHCKGCRPDLSFDDKHISWGNGDYDVGVADLDLGTNPPQVTNRRNTIESKKPVETYHCDWSPDARYIAFSRGAKHEGKNLHGLLPEFPGVEAPGWDTCVADAHATNRWVQITFDGKSNKEPDWQFAKPQKGNWFTRLLTR